MASHIFRNARLSDGSHVDVHVSAGIVEKTTPHNPITVVNEHDTDAKGQLFLPTLAEPHAHFSQSVFLTPPVIFLVLFMLCMNMPIH
jgi:dihydroorotase-like cyclic amidohydrolase